MLKKDYAKSPAWLKKLMIAWADGMNWYLATHPEVHPTVITRYLPWMALSFTEGSIGGDITRVSLDKLAAFYGATPQRGAGAGRYLARGLARRARLQRHRHRAEAVRRRPRPAADQPARHLQLPRRDADVVSDQGLDAYGASTWGQFFVYQGFNKHIGWMHTSTGVDAVDQFAETMRKQDGHV